MNVGIAGLGRMGAAIARRLKDVGHAVTVWNRSAEKVKPLVELGASAAKAEDVARARPVLDQLCRRVDHVGPVGAGSSMKLAINLPLATFWQSLGEANALCRHLGADAGWLIELFADTSGGTNVLRARGSAVAAVLSSQDPGAATLDCDSIRKDLRTTIAEARSRGFELPIAARTLAVYDEASKDGWGRRDCIELLAHWSNRGS